MHTQQNINVGLDQITNSQTQNNSNTEKQINTEINTEIDTNSDTDSDTDTYINITEMMDFQKKNIYQVQINNDVVIIKHIGHGSHVPDIIIKEEFGKGKNLNLYNCVYTNEEIDFLKNTINEDKFLPIIKLIEKSPPNIRLDSSTGSSTQTENKIYTLSVKLNCLLNYNEPISDFSIWLTYSTNNTIYHKELEKNINSTNIIEKILEKIIELGINIL
jgi:hypothetical protein